MTAREWFEDIRARPGRIAKMEDELAVMQSQCEARGQTFEPMGRGGGGDASSTILRVVEASEELDAYKMATRLETDKALLVLYGRHGNGGLAKLKGAATADAICGYYLMGMSWREVADNLVQPNSKDGEQWCKRRAYRGFECMEHKGITYLVYY